MTDAPMSPTSPTSPDPRATLILRPGSRHPISGQRTHWAERLLAGRAPEAAALLMPSLYALCGQAHRVCADLAVEAAVTGRPAAASTVAARALTEETIREHIRRIWLEWPQQLADTLGATRPVIDDLADLAGCALLQRREPGAGLARGWIERHVLGLDAEAWLANWTRDPAAWLADWSARTDVWPARALSGCEEDAQTRIVGRPLHVHSDPAQLRRLARSIAADDGFASFPTSNRLPAETGCWTRAGAAVSVSSIDTVWLRLGARIAELATLGCALSGAASCVSLACGAVPTGEREALAWCEMARGLLLHQVRLSDGGTGPVIERYRVVAPTEWNFHPRGALARRLRDIAPTPDRQARRQIAALAAAYDPCVAYAIADDVLNNAEAAGHA